MKAIPCARQLAAEWHNSRDNASRSRIGLQHTSWAILPRPMPTTPLYYPCWHARSPRPSLPPRSWPVRGGQPPCAPL